MKKDKLVEMLYQTEAFKVAPADKPFWYTSGKLGPFYINTHYLYGSGKAAEDLLAKIDATKAGIADEAAMERAMTAMLLDETMRTYKENDVYHQLIDGLVAEIRNTVDLDEIDFISGGERRDWFFSIPCAQLLKKPHLTLFKEGGAVIGYGDTMMPVGDDSLGGAVCLHIADLVTEASSYVRAWIPFIERIGGVMKDTFAIVDRRQGGGEILRKMNVQLHTMMAVEESFFLKAFELKFIDEGQLAQLQAYEKNPDAAMKTFFKEHPDFLEKTLAADPAYGGEKAKKRAELCVEKGFHLPG